MYGASCLRESLSGSLSESSMRQLIGTGLLEGLGGELGEYGRGLSFLSGCEGVVGWPCSCCVVGYVRSVVFLFNSVSSCVGGLWLSGFFFFFG